MAVTCHLSEDVHFRHSSEFVSNQDTHQCIFSIFPVHQHRQHPGTFSRAPGSSLTLLSSTTLFPLSLLFNESWSCCPYLVIFCYSPKQPIKWKPYQFSCSLGSYQMLYSTLPLTASLPKATLVIQQLPSQLLTLFPTLPCFNSITD